MPTFRLILVLLVAPKEISFFECTRLSMLLLSMNKCSLLPNQGIHSLNFVVCVMYGVSPFPLTAKECRTSMARSGKEGNMRDEDTLQPGDVFLAPRQSGRVSYSLITLLIIRFFRFLSFGCEHEPSIMLDVFLHVTNAMRLIKYLSLKLLSGVDY